MAATRQNGPTVQYEVTGTATRRETYPSHVSAQREAAKEAGRAVLLVRRHWGDRGIAIMAWPGSSTRTAAMRINRLVGLERIVVYEFGKIEVNHVIAASAAHLRRMSGLLCPS